MAVVLTTEPTNEDTYLVNGIPIRWKIIIFITVGGMLSGSYGRYRFLHGQVRQAMYGSCHISQLYHLNVIILGLMVLSEIGSEYLTRDAMIAFLWLELILWLPSYFLFMSDDVRTTCIVVNPPEDPLEPPVAYGPIPYANVIRYVRACNYVGADTCMCT